MAVTYHVVKLPSSAASPILTLKARTGWAMFLTFCSPPPNAPGRVCREGCRLLCFGAMDPLHATIEEFAADGYTHVECFCPRCRVIRLRSISFLPRISLGLTIAQLSARLRCAECGDAVSDGIP